MRASRVNSLLRLLVPVAAVSGLLALAGGAYAKTTVQSFGPDTEPITLAVSDTCRGGLPGSLTGTSVTTGQLVSTDTGNHVQGTQTGTFRVDYADGSYALGSFSSPFESGGPFMPPVAVFTDTDTLLAKLTIHDANGEQLGAETIHWVQHMTVTIMDGDVNVRSSIDTMAAPVVTCAI